MSQNDYIIENAPLAAVRLDITQAFQAAVSNSLATTAPFTTYAGQFWFDSTDNVLKIRDQGDSAWLALPFSVVDSALAAGLDSVAIAEWQSTTKGILFPRMTNTQRDAISTPPTGLLIYSTTDSELQQYNGSAWVSTSGGAGDLLAANNLSDVANASTSFDNIKQAATLTTTGVVERSTSAENVTGTDDTVYPTVAGTKEMIDTHGSGGDLLASNNLSDVVSASTSFTNIKQAASLTVTGVVEQSTSAENVAGTSDTVFPSVAGTKEMIDTHASSSLLTTTDSITAGTTQTQAGATALTAQLNRVTTATAGDGVKLPTAVAGDICHVMNATAVSIEVYPNTSDTLDGNGANVSSSLAPLTLDIYEAIDTTDWLKVGATAITFMSATGGSITTDGDYKVHTFNSSGTFTPTVGNDPTDGDSVEYLVIAGGGGGGMGTTGGGAGAGGYKTATGFTVTDTGLTVTVGAGGAGATVAASKGVNGSNSVFDSITSTGGGGGGSGSTPVGATGGSGGGGGNNGAGGIATPSGQGNDGGLGVPTPVYGGGGGGGAGAVGVDGTTGGGGGNGGAGSSSSITGSAVTRAGGGGGGTQTLTAGVGGTGGGGDGRNNTAGLDGGAGTVNTGSGGGGQGAGATYFGGAGGSGVVIIRYKFQ